MANPEPRPPAPRWWGDFTLAPETMGRWQIGPLQLWAQRLEGEWCVAWRTGPGPAEAAAEVSLGLPPAAPTAGMNVARFGFQEGGQPLRVVPALADRSVVVRPEQPFFIPAGEAATLFVSTPLWVRIFIGSGVEPLLEIPTSRPSDTWFGPDTRVGELCYAGRTLAYTRMQALVPEAHRAITPVRIHNEAHDALAIERLRVPVPLLMLGTGSQDQFWTQSLTLERRVRGGNASLQLGDMMLPGGGRLQTIGGPRQAENERAVRRALSRFFG